jgi:hypothetical protein
MDINLGSLGRYGNCWEICIANLWGGVVTVEKAIHKFGDIL